ncbi:MAG: hypothetical protein AAF526_00645 [Pseudomonadota bacterium]
MTKAGERCRNLVSADCFEDLCTMHYNRREAGFEVPTIEIGANPNYAAPPATVTTPAAATPNSANTLPSHMLFAVVIGFGLYVSEYLEIVLLDVPHFISVSGLDVVGLAIGNAPGLLLAMFAALLVIGTMLGLLATVLAGVIWAIWFVGSPVIIALLWIGASIAYLMNWLLLNLALAVMRPFVSYATAETLWPVRQLLENGRLINEAIRDHPSKYYHAALGYASNAYRWYRSFCFGVYRATTSPKKTATQISVLVMLFLLIVGSNGVLSYHYNQRISIATSGETDAKSCIIAGKLGFDTKDAVMCWIDELLNLAANRIKPVETVRLVFRKGYPTDASYVSLGRATVEMVRDAEGVDLTVSAPNPNAQVSEEVVYVGDYGDWAVVQRHATNEPNVTHRRVLVRRHSIVELSSGEPKEGRGHESETAEIEVAERLTGLEGRVAALQQRPQIVPQATVVAVSLEAPKSPKPQPASIPAVSDPALMRFGLTLELREVIRTTLAEVGVGNMDACLVESQTLGTLFFDEGHVESSELGAKLDEVLDDLASRTSGNPGPHIVFVRGRASSIGSRRQNIELSERRAEWVAEELRMALTTENLALLRHFVVPFGAGEPLDIGRGEKARPLAEILHCDLGQSSESDPLGPQATVDQ